MNSHRPFQETYYQQRVLSSLRFAVIAARLVRGLLHHRLTMQRSQLSAHYARVRRKIFIFFCASNMPLTYLERTLFVIIIVNPYFISIFMQKNY